MITEDFKTRGARTELEQERDMLNEFANFIGSLTRDLIDGAAKFNQMASIIRDHADAFDIRTNDPVDITDALGDLASLKYYIECERDHIKHQIKSAAV